MNKKYLDYNIIPIGDHCAIPGILKVINLRLKSYPFDWVTKIEHLYDTNIMYNISLINQLKDDTIENIVKTYIGDAFDDEKKINKNNNIWFPHDENITSAVEKYERRFNRLKQDLPNKNIFILLTRHYYINKDEFKKIIDTLLSYNNESIIIFISGTDHEYFENIECKNVIFKYIHYDILQFYNYDYTSFRPNVQSFLMELLL